MGIHDLNRTRAEDLARAAGGVRVFDSVIDAVHNPKVEAVIVSTLPTLLARCVHDALKAGKHVLVEEPGGCEGAEVRSMMAAAERQRVSIRVGSHLRFAPALQQAQAILKRGDLGPLLTLRAVCGHAGGPGFERDWRCNPRLSGGGQLMDGGAPLLGLVRWLAGDFNHVQASLTTLRWEIPVEDTVRLEIETSSGCTAWVHTSSTEWQPLFRLELIARNGLLRVESLPGSVLPTRVTQVNAADRNGPAMTWEFPEDEWSLWRAEIEAFTDSVGARAMNSSLATPLDALAVAEVLDQLYFGRPWRSESEQEMPEVFGRRRKQ